MSYRLWCEGCRGPEPSLRCNNVRLGVGVSAHQVAERIGQVVATVSLDVLPRTTET